jgi:transposase InsO family protein
MLVADRREVFVGPAAKIFPIPPLQAKPSTGRSGSKTLFIEPGSPWENGHVESFNGKMRDELLNRELFDTLGEAKTLCGRWVTQYNTVRPHSALGTRPPTPEAPCRPPWRADLCNLRSGIKTGGRSLSTVRSLES